MPQTTVCSWNMERHRFIRKLDRVPARTVIDATAEKTSALRCRKRTGMHEIHVDGKHVHACYLAECSNCASGCEFAEVPAFPPDRIRDVQEELSAFVVVFYFEGKAVAYDRGVPLIVQYGIRYSFCAGSQIG